MTCKCKVRKAEITCEKQRQGRFTLPCDDHCEVKATERRLADEALMREKAAAEEEQNRIEMEEFQRKYGAKKPKERKPREISVDVGRNWPKIALIAVAVIIPIVGVLVFWTLND